MKRTNLLLVSVLTVAVPAHAFDKDEHARVSGNAVRIAKAAFAGDAGCKLDAKQPGPLAPFLDPDSPVAYGKLVYSVDYRINPLQILQTDNPQRRLPQEVADLDGALLERLPKVGPAFLRAAAANDTHFQGELFAGIRHWHAYAVDVAARERNVFAALVVNSIAEHFLQDFFAPGHIVTPRFGLHDAAALAFHNHYNSRGSTFVIDETLYERDLLPLLQYVCAADLDIRVLATAPGLGKTPVPLWGDSNLKQSPEQELLMTLVSARSVLDILESAASGNAVNSFQDVQWVPTARLPGSRRLLLAGGRLPYGRYEHLQKDVRFLYGGTILGLSGGAQVLRSSAVTTMRTAYQLDWIVTGNPPILAPRGQFSGRSYSIRIGYVYEHNEDEIARGPAARAVWAIPLIHSQVSGDVAYKTYLRGSDGARKLAYGVRYQTGFSVLNLDLGVGRDYTFTTGGLEPALATRFGFTVAGPVSSIPVLGEIEKSIFRWRRRSLEGATSRSPEQRTSSGVR